MNPRAWSPKQQTERSIAALALVFVLVAPALPLGAN